MTKTYTTIRDYEGQEIRPVLMDDDDFANLDNDAQDAFVSHISALMLERDLIVWEDGYDGANYQLNRQGFRSHMDTDLEGADFWDVVRETFEHFENIA